MSDLLFITRKGAGVPMRVRVVHLPGPRCRAIVRRLGSRGMAASEIARRLKLVPAFVDRVLSPDERLGWGAMLRKATRAVEREMAA